MSNYRFIKSVRNFYDKTANTYDSLYRDEQEKKYRLALTILDKEKLKDNILDAGCGTGLFEEFFKPKNNLTFFCVDVSSIVLRKFKDKLRHINLDIFLVCCNLYNLPFKDNIFNCCLMFTVLQNLPKPVLALKEIGRTLKSDAYIVVTGLKEKYTRIRFQKILLKSGFKGKIVNDPNVNEYVAVGKVGKVKA